MKRPARPLLLLTILVFGSVHLGVCSVGRASLKGGCATVEITPPLGIVLIGSKGQPSDSVMDPLHARAMVLGDGRRTIAIVSAELLYTPLEEITGPVRAIVTAETGIPPENVMVCAVHTHSGPEVFTRSKVPNEGRLPAEQIDRTYQEALVKKMASCVRVAQRHMQAVRIGTAAGRLPEIVYNRRPRNENGRVEMAFTLPPEVTATQQTQTDANGHVHSVFTLPPEQPARTFGPIDPNVYVLRMEDTAGRIVGSLVDFGCHPVCVYPYESTAISADYPGHTTRAVERATGGISLFALGLAGNAVPLTRGVEPCAQMGKRLGAEAVKQLGQIAATDDVTLDALRREVTFPLAKSPAAESGGSDTPETVTTELQVLRLGDIYILGLPGEVLVEVGLAIHSKAGLKNLLIVTLANDAIGYVCHRAAYEEGGYEPGSGTNLAPGAGEIMVEQALALLAEARQASASRAAAAEGGRP
ncbi:MAG: neutral/alkaline non-lysosomal ceramidase N-terminal domain-containing protein [Sedimentisphaerales bacterium]|nr:neutral/alkaline non-lysosomal ceramidase N-terminal domain-containing protein [Sedimentisphaerales bacterium]